MLPVRGSNEAESDFSWTVDFAARRAKAREEMAPHLEEVETQKLQAVALKEKITGLKKKGSNDDELKLLRDALANAERSSREAQSRADAIDAAVYDLKAVNPKARVIRDTRSASQIIGVIAQHGRVVDDALARLKECLGSEP